MKENLDDFIKGIIREEISSILDYREIKKEFEGQLCEFFCELKKDAREEMIPFISERVLSYLAEKTGEDIFIKKVRALVQDAYETMNANMRILSSANDKLEKKLETANDTIESYLHTINRLKFLINKRRRV